MQARVVTVGSTAIKIVDGGLGSINHPAGALILNPTGSGGTIYLGGPDVDTTDGYPIPAGADPFSAAQIGGSDLYAVSAGSVDVNVLRDDL